MCIQCNDYLRSDQAQQDLTLLFIYYAKRRNVFAFSVLFLIVMFCWFLVVVYNKCF